MISVRDTSAGVTFSVKVHPRSRKNAITGQIGDAVKVSLIAPPIDGRANEACIEFFAKLLKVPRSSVTIASGESSRNKVIRVVGLSAEEVKARIAVKIGKRTRARAPSASLRAGPRHMNSQEPT